MILGCREILTKFFVSLLQKKIQNTMIFERILTSFNDEGKVRKQRKQLSPISCSVPLSLFRACLRPVPVRVKYSKYVLGTVHSLHGKQRCYVNFGLHFKFRLIFSMDLFLYLRRQIVLNYVRHGLVWRPPSAEIGDRIVEQWIARFVMGFLLLIAWLRGCVAVNWYKRPDLMMRLIPHSPVHSVFIVCLF